jgi:type IV secretion system protein VirD4
VSLWIAVQSLSQLDAVYGKVRAQVLRDNMESQIYYRPSNQEPAEYLERCLGKTSEYAHSETQRHGAKISHGLSEQGVPLLTAGEIKQMGDGDILGFHRRLPPFRGTRMDWRGFAHLVQRQRMPAPAHPELPQLEETFWHKEQRRDLEYVDPDNLD